MIRLTADLKARLHAAIAAEDWDAPGETTLHDEALAHVDAVPTGTVLAPGEADFDAHEQPVTDLAHAWVSVEYFGFQNVEGDWHHQPPRPLHLHVELDPAATEQDRDQLQAALEDVCSRFHGPGAPVARVAWT